MNFYEKLLSYKAINKLSWSDIGVVVNKEQAAIRIAVTRESLSKLEIKELEKKFFSEQDVESKSKDKLSLSNDEFIYVGNYQVSIDDFVSALIKNTSKLEDHPSYIILKNSIKERAKRDYLEELYEKQKESK